jgi:hypothetical protein
MAGSLLTREERWTDHPAGGAAAIARPSAHNYLTERGDVSLNYIDTDVREIVRLVLGNILKLNYTIDPGFRGCDDPDGTTAEARRVVADASGPLPRLAA